MPWIELSAPAELAVDFDLLKSQLRLTSDDEDDLLTFYAEAAIDLFERETNQRLINRTVRWEQPDFPVSSECVELPVGPVSSVTHVKYYDTAGQLQTWASDAYVLDATSHFPKVRLAPNETFPTVQDDRHDGVQVTFVAGYGDDESDVPKGIKWCVFLLAAHMFTNRMPINIGSSVSELPFSLQRAIGVYKLRRA